MGLVMRNDDHATAEARDDEAHADAPLSENLLEQFASYYLLSVLAVKAFEAARAHYAKTDPSSELVDASRHGRLSRDGISTKNSGA